jgi:hypothetical protein
MYGFDFPEDLFRFWEFAQRLRPLEPLRALEEDLKVTLVGPFEVLAGRFDSGTPRYSLLLHWRYHDDPPEFFTVLAGGCDGPHFGYYLDDPGTGPCCVANYYAVEGLSLAAAGDTLFEAMRLNLEYYCGDFEDLRQVYTANTAEHDDQLGQLTVLRERLVRSATGDRRQIGNEYTDLYDGITAREQAIVAETADGMGIVVPAARYRPLSLPDKKLWAFLRRQDDPVGVVAEARRALREGFPGTALKLGKDLWAKPGRTKTAYAYELLDAAYAALGREVLRNVLRTHRANRDLPTVDILEAEGERNGDAG